MPAIEFTGGSAQPSTAGMKSLDAVAMVLLEDPAIDRAAVLGHAAVSPELGEVRAFAVLELLVRKGVDRERLEAHAENAGGGAHLRDGRVEIRVLRRSGWDWYRWNGTEVVPGDPAPVGSRPTSPRPCDRPIPPCRKP